jgi:hypothetical protein
MFLQLSHVVYQRFVAGDNDDESPAEHYAIACAIGQIMRDGVDSYRDDQWDLEQPPLNLHWHFLTRMNLLWRFLTKSPG